MFVAAVLVALALAPGKSDAQACCSPTDPAIWGSEGRGESWVLGAEFKFREAVASFDADGRRWHLGDSQVRDWALTLAGGFRFGSRAWQLYASVPFLVQRRSFGTLSAPTHFGFGDSQLMIRWTPLEDPMNGWEDPTPFLDLFASAQIPTGRAPEEARSVTGADVTGDGTWHLRLGLQATKFIDHGRHAPSMELVVGHSMARQPLADGPTIAQGLEFALRAGWLYALTPRWSLTTSVDLQWRRRATDDGRKVARSESRRTLFGLEARRVIIPFAWEASASLTSDAWWSGATTNLAFAGPSASLGIRRFHP